VNKFTKNQINSGKNHTVQRIGELHYSVTKGFIQLLPQNIIVLCLIKPDFYVKIRI